MSEIRLDKSRKMSIQQKLMIAGGFLLGLGIVVILLGWHGVAHSPYVFDQNAYIVSGGLLGVGFTLVGGFLYFGSLVSRLGDTIRTENDRLIEALGKLPSGSSGASAAADGRLVATPTGTMIHRPDCAVVVGRTDTRVVKAGAKGMRPCRLCDPLGEANVTSLVS